ncbi:MAG: polyribonucleotide nucleotidyltransferase [Candidatus Zixiibacteriota bacterium]|jgi:polyribonucleotide nucleotidyltransferase
MTTGFDIETGGRNVRYETGKVAKLADGACTVTCGGSVVLATFCNTEEPRPGIDWLPLMVEYREKTYAAGKIPGGFFKREGRPSEKETVTARLIDRPIRPLFDAYIRNDLQIITTALSADQENDTDVLALNGASLAVSLSAMPWYGPVGAVRVGLDNGNYVINPSVPDMETSRLDLIVVSTTDKIVMMAGSGAELTEDEMMGAVEAGFAEASKTAQAIADFTRHVNKMTIPPPERDAAFEADVKGFMEGHVRPIIDIQEKIPRRHARTELVEKTYAKFDAEDEDAADKQKAINTFLEELEEAEIRRMAFEDGTRQDGRGFDELRPIDIEVSVLPRAHGSAIFTRGQTQALVATTLGTVSDEQRIDDLLGDRTKAFMLHYNFPPFSVGEVKPIRGAGRREIGHGQLAETSLQRILPGEDDFPYTVRVVSDILESNGSSSMASVCGASLSLMDAGVPVKNAVAGISIGLISGDERNILLTDIQGLEDHYGDMDFKVAGTRDGVTAVQLDMKVRGLTLDVIRETFAQAREARFAILDRMDSVIAKPRPELSPYAPRILITFIDVEKIGTVIGPGGKMVRRIIAETGASIDIEDDGKVTIASPDEEAARKALEMVKTLVTDPEVGAVFKGKVVRIMKFGAFVEILPGVDGMIHISDLEHHRVNKVEDVVNIGDEVEVKVIEIDDMGRVNLSRKALLPGGPPEGSERSERSSRDGRPPRRRNDRRSSGERRNKKDRR